jgi:hypothetical protein
MAAFLNRSRFDRAQFDAARTKRECLTRQTRKISTPLINNLSGKKCLVRRRAVQSLLASCSYRCGVSAAKQHWNRWHSGMSRMIAIEAAQHRHLINQRAAIRKIFPIKSIFTLPVHGVVSRLLGPASPTASPESEFVSHGCVASRGVCKGAPH